jgi:hypothetical protein
LDRFDHGAACSGQAVSVLLELCQPGISCHKVSF